MCGQRVVRVGRVFRAKTSYPPAAPRSLRMRLRCMLQAVGGSLERRRKRDKTWKFDRELGEGGTAKTWLGVRTVHGCQKRVAVKDFKEEWWNDPEFRSALLQEGSIGASLRHSNIVSVIDVVPELGRLVLELVDGVNLHRLLDSLPGRRMPADLVCYIAAQLCWALRCLHHRRLRGAASGVVHRDVKLSNVLISYEGEVKLIDFGLAKRIKQAHEPYSKVIRGTPEYLSPEQSHAVPDLDGRSDLHALGIVCHELLTSERPYDRDTPEETIRATRAGLRRKPIREYGVDAPEWLFALIDKLLAKDREDRFPSADAVLDELLPRQHGGERRRELAQLAAQALPPQTVQFTRDDAGTEPELFKPRPVRRHWIAAAAGVTLAVNAALGVAWALSRPPDGVPQSSKPVAQLTALPAVETSVSPSTAAGPAQPTAAVDDLQAPVPSADSTTDGAAEPSAPAPSGPRPASAPGQLLHTTPSAPRRTTGKTKAAATGVEVHVGSLPLPQVNIWVDGKAQGRGPVPVILKPGWHTFAAGRERPEYEKKVELHAGQEPLDVTIVREGPGIATESSGAYR